MKTGYPIVDAGMRQLRETGYMYNRVRMIVASFLVKNLLIDWRVGMEWFNDCLCDADLANILLAGNGPQEAELMLRHISEYLILYYRERN